jgi:hypothetical protein
MVDHHPPLALGMLLPSLPLGHRYGQDRSLIITTAITISGAKVTRDGTGGAKSFQGNCFHHRSKRMINYNNVPSHHQDRH